MAYIQLPNGKYIKVPEGMSPNEAYEAALIKFPNLLEEPQQKKGLGAALGKGFESTLGALRTGVEATISPEEAAKKGLARSEALSEKYADQTSFEQLKKAYEERGVTGALGEVTRQVPLAIAEQAPNLATMYAGAKLGARAPIPGAYGKLIGAGLGALAPSLLQQFGGNIERQAQEQKGSGQPLDISRGKALAAAAPQAALDVASTFIPLGGKVAGKVFGPQVEKLLMRGGTEAAEKLAQESFAKTLGKGLAVGAAAEIPTEIAQQMLERAQAGLSLTSADALKEYGETAYQVGLLAPIGGAGRFVDRSAARGEIKAKEQAEQTRLAEEQAKAAEEAKLNKEAMDEMARIAAENQPKFGYDEQQIESMRRDIISQRNTFTNELDRLREQAQGESDLLKLSEITDRAQQIQEGLNNLSPAAIEKQIKQNDAQLKALQKELKVAQKEENDDRIAEINTSMQTIADKSAELKASLPAYQEVAKMPDGAKIKEQIATKLAAIDKARESGDLEALGRLVKQVKELQGQYTGEQPSLFETTKQGFAYPEAERRETAEARAIEETRPDMSLAAQKSEQEKRMDETMDLLREQLPEVAKRETEKIKELPLAGLRGHMAELEAKKRELLAGNPELTKAVDEQTYLTTLDEQKKKLTPGLSAAAKTLAGIEDSILATQQRIDEEELGKKIPSGDKIPQSLYEMPKGLPSAQYNRFADKVKGVQGSSLDELTQTLFNISKGIKDDIANTPELLNKKISGLRAIIVKSALREASARRAAEGLEMLSTDEAVKVASRIDANLTELVNRIIALPKKEIIDALGVAVEPRLIVRGRPNKRAYERRQQELEQVRADIVKADTRIQQILKGPLGVKAQERLAAAQTPEEVAAAQKSISRLPDMAFVEERKRQLTEREAELERKLRADITGEGLTPFVEERLGKITIDPRDLSERPLANLKRALDVIKEDIDEAIASASTGRGKLQKVSPLDEGKLLQERDPIKGLNKLLPKTRQIDKLKSELYRAQNAATPDADLIADLKRQLVDKASDKRSAALFLEEIDALRKQDKEIYEKKTKQEDVDMERVAPSGVVPAQRELFDEKDLEPLATIRATPQNFMRFLGSVEVYKMREKLGLLEKKDAEIAERMSKAPSLAVLKAQRELVNDLNNIDEVIATYRWNAAQMWQGRRQIANALDVALKELATGTTPKIEELKRQRKKFAFKQYTPEFKKITDQIKALQDRLYEENFAKVGQIASGLYAYDLAVEERIASIDYIQEKIQDLQVRNVNDEKKVLAKMERQYANQGTPASKKVREQLEKARAETAVAEAKSDVLLKQKVATKRVEEQQSKEALAQLPVIRRFTVQTRAFTKAENVKSLRAERRKLEKQQEKLNPGSPQHTKLGQQIGVLNEEIARGIQPLLQTVVQASAIPEPAVKRKAKKEGVRFAKGQTTGYDYITMTDKELDAALGKPSEELRPMKPGTGVTIENLKEKEAEARDKLQKAKDAVTEQNRAIAAATKALGLAKTPAKIKELKAKLAGLKQSATKNKLGDKVTQLTKEYRELRELGTGVEASLKKAEDAPLREARAVPLKTGVKKKLERAETPGKEATRREYAEIEAAEAGVSRIDYVNVLDGMERGFKAREEQAISGEGLSQSQVKGLLGKIKMPKGLEVEVIAAIPEGMANIIRSKGYNPAGIKGWVSESGKVVIVAGNHLSIKDAEKTIAHELIGHVGVEGLLGEAGMRALAKKIMSQEGGVMALAEKLGVREDAMGAYMAAIKSGKTKEEAQDAAVRELIAHTEEATPTKSFLAKAGDFIKAMVGALRAALRKMGVDLDVSTSDIYKLLRDARKNFDAITPGAYVKDGKIQFRSGEPVANDMFASTLKATKGIIAEQKSWVDRIKGEATGLIFETKYVDQFAPIAAVAKKMADSLKATQMMYYLRMHGQRMSFVSEVASNGPLDIVKAKDGKGFVIESQRGANLADMAKALGKARVGDSQATTRVFTLWMAAQRAKTVGLNKLDFSGKITQEMLNDVERTVAADKQTAAAFKEASDIYAKYNEGLINFAVKAGAISEKDAKAMLANKNYIPFYRQRPNTKEVFLEIGGAPAIKIGNLTDQPYLHELIGGDEAIFDIFTSALQNTSMLTDMALRNMATKDVANSLASMGMLKTDPDSKKDTGIHKGPGVQGPNTIHFKVDGDLYWAEVDTKTTEIPSELLVKGLQGVNTSLPQVVKMMGGVGSFLRKSITRNPAYALRQLIRDPLNAAFVSGVDTVPIASSIKEIVNMWRGKSDGETMLQKRGILGGQVLTGTAEDMKKVLNDLLSGTEGWDYRMAQLDKLSIQGDASTRIVMYNNFIKQGLSDMEATLATLEAMNFSKRGISPSLFQLSIMVPFMNAQIQGLNVLYKAWKGQMPFNEKLNIKKKMMERAAMMAAFTVVYAALMQDDEAYQNANDDEKYSNWFFPNPFGEDYIRVPIPFEVGLLFKAVPEALVNTVFGDAKAKDSMSAIAKMAWNNVPNFSPAGVKPVVEIASNYSFYTGREIENARMQQYEPGERYNERTTEIAKSIGGALNISPTKIEYLIRGYMGAMPLALASMANPILRTSERGETPDSRGIIGSETPLIGSFFQPKDAGGLINKAYGDMNDVIKAKQTYNKMLEEGRDSEAQSYVDANADVIAMSSMAGKFRQQMGELTKQERSVRAATGISGKEKREALDEIRQAKIELAKQFSSARE